MKGIAILGTGSYVPSHIMTNADFEQIIDTSDEWIYTRTGIRERRISQGESTLDLAYEASVKAIANSGVAKEEIGLILVATMTPDHFTPSTACLLQEKLGLNDSQVMAFDISAACSGFVYALDTARALLHTLEKPYALVVGAETLSRVTDFTDRTTCILFGDGAGACVLTLADKQYASYQDAKGELEALHCGSGIDEGENKLAMDGTGVFKFAVDVVPKAIEQVLLKSGLSIGDIGHVVCHQANERIIRNVYKKLGSDESKFFMHMEHFGNTSAASIPLALDALHQEQALKAGEKIILVGFGGGLTWGAILLEW